MPVGPVFYALGLLPWLAPFLRLSRRLRPLLPIGQLSFFFVMILLLRKLFMSILAVISYTKDVSSNKLTPREVAYETAL